MKHRQERLGKLILEELNTCIVRELEFPDCVVTLMDVVVTEKLDYAKVKVSVWPSEKAKEALSILKKAQGDLQYRLMKKIRIKMLPRIEFEYDGGNENAARVEGVLLGEKELEE